MTIARLVLMILVIGAATLQARLQTPAAAPAQDMPSTPGACVKWVNDQYVARQRTAAPLTAELLREFSAERTASAKRCAAQFEGKPQATTEVGALVQIYLLAGDRDRANALIARALADASLAEADRATMFVEAITVGLTEPKSDERNARLEGYVDQLDRLSGAVFTQQLNAHSRLNGYYRADDIDAGIIKHSTWIIEHAAKRPAAERTRLAGVVLSAHENMAEAWAGHGRTGDALALLDRALADWRDLPAERLAGITATRDRYRLVGTLAAPIAAPVWLNGAPNTTSLPMTGHVTLLEFTAHWCGPCKESYPGIKRMLARYGPQGFRVVFATELYGYFGSERGLEPAAEIERDREYFRKEGLDVPIAIAGRRAPMTAAGGAAMPQPAAPTNDANYKVGGIPQIQIIDRQGRIRLIMVGYDEANEPKLAAFIESLLGEK